MAITNFSAKYRTLKIGFLIPEDDISSLIEAVKINTLLWGGEHNPIIPVGADETKVIEQIKSTPVDVLHAIVNNEKIGVVLNAFPFLKSPRHFTYEMFTENWHSKKKSLVYLDSLNIIEKHYHKYFKGVPAKEGGSNCVLPKWTDTDPLANVFALTFGTYTNNFSLQDDFENAFLKGLRSKKIDIEKDKELDADLAGKISPITLTSIGLKNYRRELFRDGGIYLGDANNFDDLIFYWNLRATGLWIEFLPIQGHERYLKFIEKHLDHVAKSTKKPDFHRSIIFYYRNKAEEIIDPIFNKFKKDGIPFYKSNISNYSFDDTLHNLPTDILGWEFTNGLVDKSYGKYVVNVNLPEKKFITTESERDVSKQTLAVSLDSYSDFGFAGYTLKLPYIRDLNEFYSREVSVDSWKIRAEEDSIAVIIDLDDKTETLYPIEHQTLISKVFDFARIKAQISQPGLIARKIIEKIGGLEDARVLKIKGVRKILQEGSPGSTITRGEATKTIHENDFQKHKRLFIEAREKAELDSSSVFDYLLKKDFFRAGLELTCEQCRLKNWLTLKSIDDFWMCEYCGGQNQTSTHLKTRGDWKFRKSGLFAKDNHQEGAIPVLLTLLAIKRIADHSNFTYSTALELSGENLGCETDLCIVQYGRHDKIEIAIGECKSEGGVITKDDCNKLKEVVKKISSNGGMEAYIIFSKTSDAFLPEEIVLFKELSKEARLILLTNRELEPYHIYWLEEGGIEEDVPEKYPHSFSDLVRNSFARYLKN